ncbi:hypothetical protein ACWEQL_30930 [Kitasatospora sp. NPDC004240]
MPQSALRVLTGLLDRSITRIAAAAADGRTFDRPTVIRFADVWDNNTAPLFAAATARTPWAREWRARRALRWMASFGESRYAWVLAESEAAGQPAAGLVSPLRDAPSGPYRGHADTLYHWSEPLTERAVAGYDLTDCRFEYLRLEGAGAELGGTLTVRARRDFDHGEPSPTGTGAPPELTIGLHAVSVAELDLGHPAGGALEFRTSPGRVELLLAGTGRLVGERAEVRIDDPHWGLSPGGRAADAVTPGVGRRRRQPRPLLPAGGGAAALAAGVLHQAMLEIRHVRYAATASRRAVLRLCGVFEGAGAELLAVAGGGEDAFRALLTGWVERGGDACAGWFAETLRMRAGRGPTGDWARELAQELGGRRAPARGERRAAPRTAQVRLIALGFGGQRHAPEREAVVHLATPAGAGAAGEADRAWELTVARQEELTRLRLGSTGAFTAPGEVSTLDEGSGERSLRVGPDFTLSWRTVQSGQVAAGGPTIGP